MPLRSRKDIISDLEATVNKYPEVVPPVAPVPDKIRQPMPPRPAKEMFPAGTTIGTRLYPENGGVKPRTPIPVTIRGEDRKWLRKFMDG